MEQPDFDDRITQRVAALVAATLAKHAADAPAADHLLAVVHARLRRRHAVPRQLGE